MKAGFSSMFFGDMRAPDLLALLGTSQAGRWFDFWFDTPCYLLEGEPARHDIVSMVRRQLEWRGMGIVTHAAAFDVNPIAYSPAMQRHTLAETQASLEFASDAGANLVTLHGGFSSFASRVSSYDVMLLDKFCDELLDFVERRKLDITLCLENDAATEVMARPLESLHIMEAVLEKHPRLCVTIDVSHVLKTSTMARAMLARDSRLDASALPGFLKKFGSRVRILHFSSPNRYRAHGRIDLNKDAQFIKVFQEICRHMNVAAVPCIFEYAIEEFGSPTEAINAIIEDATALSEKIGNE
ncbi:MAG: sugar phosphate isomerase/epimerase [Candidatus Lokiarchaeota archaeon]|nr:sugar phosphate isomerase/epimerase [Candidatus Lokiarchaeota archaeon]